MRCSVARPSGLPRSQNTLAGRRADRALARRVWLDEVVISLLMTGRGS